jgi:catalase
MINVGRTSLVEASALSLGFGRHTMPGIGYGPTQRDAQQQMAQTTTLAFTADSGPHLAELAGEGVAKRRGDALRRDWLRPVHTCGVMVKGTFEPSGKAGSGAPPYLEAGRLLPVVARFSSCSADVEIDDRHVVPRGLAVRFYLPDDRNTDLVSMSTDCFPVTTLSAFVSMSHAMSCRQPWRFMRLVFLGTLHQARSPFTFMTAFSPVSYAHCDYYPVHTFVWSQAGRPVRYRWRASAGRKRPRPWTRLFKQPDYLAKELEARLAKEKDGTKVGVDFNLEVQYPQGVKAARLRDIGRPLPRRIRWWPVGRLHLDQLITGAEAERLGKIVFSPAHLVAGVEPYPGDEIFAARSGAYPASHVYRSGGSP